MSKSKTFTNEFTSKIATLAKLQVEQNELDHFAKQFNSTLETIASLSNVDTKGTSEAYNITNLKNVTREDVIETERILSQEEALMNAKRTHKGFFVVRGVFASES